MSLFQVQPAGAYFPPPHHTRGIRNTLLLSNTSSEMLVFKVRSSNPERFVVKPTAGFIAPTSATRLAVTLKRTDEDLSGNTKDRFRISVKAIKRAEADGPAVLPKNDAKQMWESLKESPMLSESDVMCSYGVEVPATATITFVATDASLDEIAASEAAASPQHASAISDRTVSSRVTFGEGGKSNSVMRGGSAAPSQQPQTGPAAASTPSAGTTLAAAGTARSINEGLASAQRLKESVLTDIATLKERERTLNEQMAAGNAKSDGMSREALELERLRAKVTQARLQLADRTSTADQPLPPAAAASSSAPPTSTVGSIAGGTSKAASDTRSIGEQAGDEEGAASATHTRKASSSGGVPSVYLSTVLLWMLLAYVGGAVYRVMTSPDVSAVDAWAASLPDGLRQNIHGTLQSIRSLW